MFTVSFSLSEQGVPNWKEIVAELYRYIGMIRYYCQHGLPTWIYEELRSIQEVAHRYDDEPSPEDLVETLAEELAPATCLPPERLLDGTAVLFEYDPAAIKVCNCYVPNYLFSVQDASHEVLFPSPSSSVRKLLTTILRRSMPGLT